MQIVFLIWYQIIFDSPVVNMDGFIQDIQEERSRNVTQNKKTRRKLCYTIIICFIFSLACFDVLLLAEKSQFNENHTSTINDRVNKTTSEVSFEIILRNNTLCGYVTQYRLSHNKKVTICDYQNILRIDIRYFIGDYATIRGIWLSLDEWKMLLDLMEQINKSIMSRTTDS